MPKVARELVAPAYLLLCLILGGSAQGVWGNMLLQLIGLVIIAWAVASIGNEPLAAPARQVLWLALAALVVVLMQLVPLPASVWPHLGTRAWISDGYPILGVAVPPMSLSLTPYKTVDTLLGIIPGLAMFTAVVRLKAYRASFVAAALLFGTIVGILLGALQTVSNSPEQSPWYLYRETNFGSAVGFFANANHMGSLLVVTLPFLAAVPAAARARGNMQQYSTLVALAAAVAVVVVVGIVLNGSLAAYGLALPVLAASALIVVPLRGPWRRVVAIAAVVLLVGAVIALTTSSIGGEKLGEDAATSVQSRQEILATSFTAIRHFLPFGSGLGSFREVYQLYEDPASIGATYVVHAHNDYVELLLEMGVAGALLLGIFLAWWGVAVRRVWLTADTGPFARAASIASAAILAHSLVDFPLRTAAISAVFGMCVALLADRRPAQATDSGDLRPTRHFVVR